MTDKHVSAIVASRRDISSDLWVVRLRPAERIPFVPGQYVTVGLVEQGRLVERPYSVASSPQDGELEFFLELVPGGHLSPHLYDVPPGGEVFVRRQAKGRFMFDDSSGRTKHFMVATVTGVAPFLSMIRYMAGNCPDDGPHQVALLHGASVSREFAFEAELAGYARRHSWFRYIPSVSRPWLDPDWTGERGRAEDVLRKHMDSLDFTPANTTAYACGNPNMIENVKAVLERAGFPRESVKQEVYWVADKG